MVTCLRFEQPLRAGNSGDAFDIRAGEVMGPVDHGPTSIVTALLYSSPDLTAEDAVVRDKSVCVTGRPPEMIELAIEILLHSWLADPPNAHERAAVMARLQQDPFLREAV